MEIRADFVTPNPHGDHLTSIAGAERLLPLWQRLWEVPGMPVMVTVAVAPVSLFRKCLRGEATVLDLRSLFVMVRCLFASHIGVGLDSAWLSLLVWWVYCLLGVSVNCPRMFLAKRMRSEWCGSLHLHI